MENTTGALRSLRWYAVLALVVFGIVPTVMVALLVAKGRTPGSVGLLLIGGIPLILAAAVTALPGPDRRRPRGRVRRLHLSMALVAGADVLLLGGNALIRMASVKPEKTWPRPVTSIALRTGGDGSARVIVTPFAAALLRALTSAPSPYESMKPSSLTSTRR